MSDYNFEDPSRQSAKGIIVIFGVTTYKVIRGLFIAFVALFLKYVRSDKAPDLSNPILILSVIGLIALFLTIAILKYLNFKFFVKDNYFFLRKGIFNKEEISVSKEKIQNVYIKQNVIQQLINVVTVSIESAGDDKTEIEIMALSRDKAQALKENLLSGFKSRNFDESADSVLTVYYRASLKKLLLEGISENHFKSFVLILAFIISIYNDVKEFVNQLNLTSKFGKWLQLDSESVVGLLLLNVTIVLVLLILSFILSFVRMLIQNFNLTVIRKPNGLEISKGLLNKINLSLSDSRIQNTTASTNRVKRALGLYKLSFTQAMSNKKQQLKLNVVGLNKLQINELVEQFYPNIENQIIKNKPNKYLKHRMLWIGLFVIIIINIGLYFSPTKLLLINIPLIAYVIVNAVITYNKAYYHIDDEYIVIGYGMLIETHTSYLEIKKTQGVTLKQTIFQKRKGVASVIIYSASKPITIPHVELDTANAIKNYLLYKVEYENEDWM
ncbi:PH domain-containing protein [Winogradskyella sp.]|uniref:PH domain-containing protein n=1 Tax=Winogradskyella sp. TaxID=1883156 RepID=UPI003F6B8353